MSYDTEHYYAVQTFLEDDELYKIWNIIEIAMNREGYDVSNSELSLRLYDSELTENIEHDMEHLLCKHFLLKKSLLVMLTFALKQKPKRKQSHSIIVDIILIVHMK